MVLNNLDTSFKTENSINIFRECPFTHVTNSVFSSFSRGLAGIVLTVASVLWCSISASKLFVSALAMDAQQLLVAYPCALVYAVFALLTVF